MKRFLLLFIIIIIILGIIMNYHTQKTFVEKINFNLSDKEVAIAFIYIDKLDSILISTKERSLLLILNNKNSHLKSILKKFVINDLVILSLTSINDIDIDYKDKVLLSNYYYLNEIKYTLNNNIIIIQYEDTDFCIYLGSSKNNNDLSTCNFIYFYNNINTNYININDDTNVIFYHSLKPLPTHILDDIYKKWIDVHAIRKDEYTIIKIYKDDYRLIVVPNIL